MRSLRFSYLIFLLTVVLSGTDLCAQERDSLMLYFRQDKASIDTSYMDNSDNLRELETILASDTDYHVHICVASSPDGPRDFNDRLSQVRARTIETMLEGRVAPEKMTVVAIPENWGGLVNLLRTKGIGNEKVFDVLMDRGVDDVTRETILRNLDDRMVWRKIIVPNLSALRSATIIFTPVVRREVLSEASSYSFNVRAETLAVGPGLSCRPIPSQESLPDSENAFLLGVRTNMLYDLALVPNIGLEFHLGKGWALGLDYSHAWWDLGERNYFWRVYGGGLELRKYFGKRASRNPLSGHHLGLYTQTFVYDIELGGRGQLSDLTYGGGLEYGYSLPVGKHFNIDFGIGLGYLGGEYKVYDPEDGCYVWKETRQRHYYGPTKAEISLVWLIGRGKGGAR